LVEIRDSRLYREQFETFEDYCRDRWEFGRTYAHYTIEASKVVKHLDVHNCEQTPANEAQVRPLTKLETPEAQVGAWETGIKKPPEGGWGGGRIYLNRWLWFKFG
jgi:hypothetical protein